MNIIVIGGGILGTCHALAAVERGHRVIHLEREPEARGATVRNFGLVWISGRAPFELDTALRSRELWRDIAYRLPHIGFRECGSITLARTEAEHNVAQAASQRDDAQQRGFTLLTPGQVRHHNPALRGDIYSGLHCSLDAAVESRVTLPAIRSLMEPSGRYTFYPATEARSVSTSESGTTVRDDHGRTHHGDHVIVCAGAAHTGLVRELAGVIPARRVRLQMMQTEPLDEVLTTAIADGDSLRYYPGFASPELNALTMIEPQAPVAAQHGMQLLCVQRRDGGLTIGDTHEYQEPFDFDVHTDPYDHLVETVQALLGRALPPIARRWAGVYSQSTEPHTIATRVQPDPAITIVTGPGGRGMTMGPAIAEHTIDGLDLPSSQPHQSPKGSL